MPLEVGSRLSHYAVTAKLGEGGMGEVDPVSGQERWTPSFGQVFVTAKGESGVMIQATLG